MKYEISEIINGQYTVRISLDSILSPSCLEQMKNDLENLKKNDPFICDCNGVPIIEINENILSYTSETIFPERLDSKKDKVLVVLGNPATHSVKHGMFYFSKLSLARHNIWKKFHDANLIKLINCSNLSNLSKMEMRETEANERRKIILDGTTSKKYLLGLTTFYSFPTPVVKGYRFSNVEGVLKLFDPIIESINMMESKRILDYPFTADAILVFVQKDSYNAFEKNRTQLSNDKKYKRLLFWPSVSRQKNAKSSGKDLLEMLEKQA